MNPAKSLIRITQENRLLTAAEFRQLADVPAEIEWFRNLDNQHTERAYRNAIRDFMRFTGIRQPEEFRLVTRAHVIAWRDTLVNRHLDRATVRHRLSALASLFEYLCDRNAVAHNPVKGVRRPKAEANEGKTPALGDHQARKLLAKPNEGSLKGKRDRAILATLLYHALRRQELCKLSVKDFDHERRGVAYPDALRRVSYVDPETNRRFRFLTNNFVLPALTIARIYKSRWQVELFFKWIKQHLRIKAFYGLSENAVKTQIWIAVSVYVLVAIVRKRLRLDASLYQILQILSLSLFEKMPILQALQPSDSQPEFHDPGKQLILFDL